MKRSRTHSKSPSSKKSRLKSSKSNGYSSSKRSISRRGRSRENKREPRRDNISISHKSRKERSPTRNNDSTIRRRRRAKSSTSPTQRANTPDNEFQTLSISNLNNRISDSEVRDVMYKEFNTYDKFVVKVVPGAGVPRVVYINFNSSSDARHARKTKAHLKLFGLTVRIDPIYGIVQQNLSPIPQPPVPPLMPAYGGAPVANIYSRPAAVFKPMPEININHILDADITEQTRTILITGLDPTIGQRDIQSIFASFGAIEDIALRQDRGKITAFVTYCSVDMARAAKIDMSGRNIGEYKCRICYTKSPATNCLWIGGLGNFITGEQLEQELDRFAVIRRIEWPRDTLFAYVLFDSMDAATAACNGIRGVFFRGQQLRVDYVNPNNIEILRPYLRDIRRPREPRKEPAPLAPRHRRDHTPRRRKPYTPPAYPPGSLSPPPAPRREEPPARDERPPAPAAAVTSTTRKEDGATNVKKLASLLPVVWSGVIALKSSNFGTSMHLLTGSVDIVDNLLRDHTTTEMASIRITQRLRLDEPKLEDIERKLNSAGDHNSSILLAMPNDSKENAKSLTHLVTYLKSKQAAGVVAVDPLHQGSIIHTFPPCAFANRLVAKHAGNVVFEASDDYLVIVVVKA